MSSIFARCEEDDEFNNFKVHVKEWDNFFPRFRGMTKVAANSAIM
jgi:hypothetical protein